MKDIERARKIVAESGAARAEIEAAISECKTAMTADEAELAKLAEERDTALVAGGDRLRAHKSAQVEADERLATRRALVNVLDKRLEEVIESERRAEIAKARAQAEAQLEEAVNAIGDYDSARKTILAIVAKIKAANAAADNFERRYTDEPRLSRAEAMTRQADCVAEEIISEEVVELWIKENTGAPVNEREVNQIVLSSHDRKMGIIPKSGVSKDFAGGYPVVQRKFLRLTFLPEAKAPRSEPLVSGVQLPPLLPEQARLPKTRLIPEPDSVVASAA